MEELLVNLNKYSSLINITLLLAIIGYLIHISRLSRTALQDKHASDIAAKNNEIKALITAKQSLQDKLDARSEQYSSKIDLLQYQLSYFQKIADLPDNQRVEAIKHDYQEKIKQLEKQLEQKELSESVARSQIKELEAEEKAVLNLDPKVIGKVIETLPSLIRLIT